MNAETFGLIAVIGYSLAGVFAVVSVIIFVTQHIRQVRNDLTGRTAARAIAQLRAGEGARTHVSEWNALKEQRKRGGGEGSAHESGSLKLRRISSKKASTTTPMSAAEASTTYLSDAQKASTTTPMNAAEASTTYLSDAQKTVETTQKTAGTEASTTLLSDTSYEADGPATTLLANESTQEGQR